MLDNHLLDQRHPFGSGEDIGRHRCGPVDTGDRLGQPDLVAGAGEPARAVPGETVDDGATDAGASAGDQDDAVMQ